MALIQADGALYVPVTLRGLMVGKPPASDWRADVTDDFMRLPLDSLGEYVPAQLTSTRYMPKGVHLHWSLPDALTRGIQSVSENGESDVVYPAVPSIWYVTRMWAPAGGKASQLDTRCWMVESDALARVRGEKTYNIGSPSRAALEDREHPWRYLGRAFPLEEKVPPPDDGYLRQPLTAVEPGNPAYAAFYPACRNVFGFYDDMTGRDGRPLENVFVSYCVAGVYRRRELDPVNSILAETEKRRKDGLGEVSEADVCRELYDWEAPEDFSFENARSVYHALLCNLFWKDGETDYQGTVPFGLPMPRLAVGNTSAEALAALLAGFEKSTASDGAVQDKERMFEHLLSGISREMLERDGVVQSENQIHLERFGSLAPTTQFVLKWNPQKSGEELLRRDCAEAAEALREKQAEQEKETVPPPPEALLKLLEDLNAAQEQLTRSRSQMEELQEKSYDLWYLSQKADSSLEQVRLEELNGLLDQTERAVSDVKGLRREADGKRASLEKQAWREGFILSPQTGQRYWEPVEPVLLLSNIQRDFSHGADGRFSKSGMLPLRAKTIGSLTVSPDTGLSLAADAVTVGVEWDTTKHAAIIKQSPAAKPDGAAEALVIEAALLCPNFAELIAAALCAGVEKNADVKRVEDAVRKLQLAVTGPARRSDYTREDFSRTAGFDADLPDKAAVEYWKAPWNPLYLDWQVEYYPDPQSAAVEPALDSWEFDGSEYRFVGKALKPSSRKMIGGRTFLTPNAAFRLEDKLKAAAIKVENASLIRVLSQSLGGLHDQLLMRQPEMQLPLEYSLNGSLNRLQRALEGYQPVRPIFDALFAPLRAGYMSISRLRIVDSFGQLQRVTADGCAVSEAMRAEAGEEGGVVRKRIMLPPRLLEPVRLRFDWVARGIGEFPVYGWLMPNFLDHSLLVFSPEGELYGSLQSVAESVGGVVWKGPAQAGGGTENIPKGLSAELAGFLTAILEAAAERKADLLSPLLAQINNGLWSVNPGGAQQQNGLSTFLGRPLALVDCTLALELLRPRRRYKSVFSDGRADPEPDITKAHFPVWIGQPEAHGDGIIGFYAEQDYGRLHLANFKASMLPDNDAVRSYFTGDNRVVLSPGTPAVEKRLTLLLDPVGKVHLRSGILPVKETALDPAAVSDALHKLYHLVFVAPTLQYGSELNLPFPNVEGKCWDWIGYEMTGQPLETDAVERTHAENAYFPEDRLCAREGWLRLKDRPAAEETRRRGELS